MRDSWLLSVEVSFQESKKHLEQFYSVVNTASVEAGVSLFEESETKFDRQNLFLMQKSSFMLMLYNVIESTIALVLVELNTLIAGKDNLYYDDLPEAIRKIWIQTQQEKVSNAGKKDWGEALFTLLESSRKPLDFGNKFLKPEEVLSFLGGAGNIDFLKIKRLLEKYGLEIKEKLECNVGKLQEIKVIRNRLAHGNLTFAKGMADKTINEIEAYMLATINTLEYLIQKVKEFYIVLNQDLETKICKRKE